MVRHVSILPGPEYITNCALALRQKLLSEGAAGSSGQAAAGGG